MPPISGTVQMHRTNAKLAIRRENNECGDLSLIMEYFTGDPNVEPNMVRGPQGQLVSIA
jgi:hypothetical protein